MAGKTFKIIAFGGDYAGPEVCAVLAAHAFGLCTHLDAGLPYHVYSLLQVLAEGLKVFHQVMRRYPDVEYHVKSYELGGVGTRDVAVPGRLLADVSLPRRLDQL